ncbi:MAG: hypothetical protein V3T86_09190 [Planctomycetota bacterium]
MIYVYDAADVDARYAIESEKALADERVLVGARFFDCVRIGAEQARADVTLKAHIKSVPCLLVAQPNGAVTRSVRRLSAPAVFGAISSAMRKDFRNCLATTLKKQKECLKARARLDRQRARLPRMRESKRIKAEQKLQLEDRALKAREEALYVLKPKK